MCKLAGWTTQTSNPLNKAAAARALLAAQKAISCQRDGFGFAQTGDNGLYGRFVEPSDFNGLDALPTLTRTAGEAAAAFAVTRRAAQTGNYRPTRSVIIHGRTATMGKGIANTHPFKADGWTMAHNGVITWKGNHTEKHKAVTCDSQHILHCLTDNQTDETRKKDLENIRGYAAFLALAPDGRFIAAVDDTAQLCAGITNRGRWIFGTTPAIVEAIAKSWQCKNFHAFRLEAWSWLSFAPNAKEPTLSTWSHARSTWDEDRFSGRSLGKYRKTYTPSNAASFDNDAKAFASFPDYEGSSTWTE
jgi:predicted glutamine amidotransferase